MTGAAGFIGSHVVSAFAADGHAVTRLDALAPSVPADEPGADDAAAPSDQAASGSDDLIYADVRLPAPRLRGELSWRPRIRIADRLAEFSCLTTRERAI